VADEILAHNGRINITELAPILNVDLPYVEHAVGELLKSDDGLQLFHGELIASYYLDSLAEEIDQQLQAAGRVTLAELAVLHTLPTEFVTKLIEPRLGTLVHAKLAGGVLYTSAYVARHMARVRGALAAVLRPTSLSQLIRDHAFNECAATTARAAAATADVAAATAYIRRRRHHPWHRRCCVWLWPCCLAVAVRRARCACCVCVRQGALLREHREPQGGAAASRQRARQGDVHTGRACACPGGERQGLLRAERPRQV
jgi:hypothetical protein